MTRCRRRLKNHCLRRKPTSRPESTGIEREKMKEKQVFDESCNMEIEIIF